MTYLHNPAHLRCPSPFRMLLRQHPNPSPTVCRHMRNINNEVTTSNPPAHLYSATHHDKWVEAYSAVSCSPHSARLCAATVSDTAVHTAEAEAAAAADARTSTEAAAGTTAATALCPPASTATNPAAASCQCRQASGHVCRRDGSSQWWWWPEAGVVDVYLRSMHASVTMRVWHDVVHTQAQLTGHLPVCDCLEQSAQLSAAQQRLLQPGSSARMCGVREHAVV